MRNTWIVVALALAVGCKGNSKAASDKLAPSTATPPGTPTPQPPVEVKGSLPTGTGAGNDTGSIGVQPGDDLEKCPSAVKQALTVVEDTDTGVALTITAATPEQQQQIRARMADLMLDSVAGTPGGARCPVVIDGTELANNEIAGGVRVTMTPKNENREMFRAKVRERAAPFGPPPPVELPTAAPKQTPTGDPTPTPEPQHKLEPPPKQVPPPNQVPPLKGTPNGVTPA